MPQFRTSDQHWSDEVGEIFVFGSNLLGHHAGGAAEFAEKFAGAKTGIGQGPQGKSYALPTCAVPGVPLTLEGVRAAVTLFKVYAYINEHRTFFVTAVGCGIAGFRHEDIAPMFADATDNVLLPAEWQEYIVNRPMGVQHGS